MVNKTDLRKFRAILEAKQAELARVLRNREAIAIEKSADAIDEVQHAAERELAIRNLDRESQLLRMVKLALQRMNEGSYGICLHCDEPISPKRLEAIPWAPYCVRCQEAIDQQQTTEEVLEDLLMNAA